MKKVVINTDGGAKGNPGPAGIGFVIRNEKNAKSDTEYNVDNALAYGGTSIGEATNNIAEYRAALWGLQNAKALHANSVLLRADSELMVKQLNGEYRVKAKDLKPLFSQIQSIITFFEEFKVEHVYRENNVTADSLFNNAYTKGCMEGNFVIGPDGEEVSKDNQTCLNFENNNSTSDNKETCSMESNRKTVILIVTGCIAAYKACEVLRLLQKQDIDVHVVMTEAGTKFVGPVTFEALSGHKVHIHEFDDGEVIIPHIDLAKMADLIAVVPATANTINKIAHGIADNLASALLLAAHSPILVAPAMNTKMYENPATINSLNLLRDRGIYVLDPTHGKLACGDVGKGALADPKDIASACLQILSSSSHKLSNIHGKQVLVTAGPTREPIDPVRYISNFSSGKMGYEIAKAFANEGAFVTLVSGPTNLSKPISTNIKLIEVETVDEMYDAAKSAFFDSDISVFAAAVGDFVVKNVHNQKIKKANKEEYTLELTASKDILKLLGLQKKESQYVVGFAAETDDVLNYARRKRIEKNCDMIVANDVSKGESTFGSDTNKVTLVTDEEEIALDVMPKADVAQNIVSTINKMLD